MAHSALFLENSVHILPPTTASPLYCPLSVPSCLPSSSFTIVILSQACLGKKFQLSPIQSGSLGRAWATLEKGNLGKACRVIRAAWARQGSHDCPSPRSSSFSGILGMTWALLPRECPRQCHPAIECPICGILSSNYAQHYNRRHGQRSGGIRQRLPPGWATEHGFLYCACGDLVRRGQATNVLCPAQVWPTAGALQWPSHDGGCLPRLMTGWTRQGAVYTAQREVPKQGGEWEGPIPWTGFACGSKFNGAATLREYAIWGGSAQGPGPMARLPWKLSRVGARQIRFALKFLKRGGAADQCRVADSAVWI